MCGEPSMKVSGFFVSFKDPEVGFLILKYKIDYLVTLGAAQI